MTQFIFSNHLKKSAALIVLCLSLLSGSLSAAAAEASSNTGTKATENSLLRAEAIIPFGSKKATVNGKEMTIEPLYETNGVTMGPLNVLIKLFDLSIKPVGGSSKAIIISNELYRSHSMELTPGQKIAILDGQMVRLPAAPTVKKNSTMVPYRAIIEAFDGKVVFEKDKKAIRIQVLDQPVVDSKQRIGDSNFGWSLGAPLQMELIDQSESGDHILFTGFSGGSFNVSVTVEENDKKLTPQQLIESMKSTLHPSETVKSTAVSKQPTGDFAFLATSHNQAFNTYYYQYWGIQANDRVYWLTVSQNSVRYTAERDRISKALLQSFRTSFDESDPNLRDFAIKPLS
ncbi:copper amine oxidase N-terminal domain-containing protein [Paenibacillus sp. NPDC058071]|uniref:copper amine oxidase N-terminal domain-containing protein n=1 Tax=Paenibacillus sp. NPDC058071 TaxID=3346326 RepID=UPI0036D93E81